MTKLHLAPTTQITEKTGVGFWLRSAVILALIAGTYCASCSVAGVGVNGPIHEIMRRL